MAKARPKGVGKRGSLGRGVGRGYGGTLPDAPHYKRNVRQGRWGESGFEPPESSGGYKPPKATGLGSLKPGKNRRVS